ncbi:hypothetical protein LWI29_024319 [Acer saccharum]|uniref:GTD-binding domain-containing protein n=1 Tax=Acer saccharum TaxID=4024 RepID=A0AA39V981_ACESA|nr:hypothetical protein LWI29_024319 [Acer saccharum]
MAENNVNSGMPETNITALKEALCAQQQLLQKLYAELDVERESSATAVSEALSMILRLQGEKSAVMMEASQYKRMTEEEICHAEENLTIYEDMMYQKELEISALQFQAQAYKCKLQSLGCDDLDDSERKYQENISLLRSTEMGSNGSVRKLKSLPDLTKQRSLNTSDKVLRIIEEKADQEINDQSLVLRKNSGKSDVGGDFESYWEQIRRLDERVNEIADYKDGGGRGSANLKDVSRSSSLLLSQLGSNTSCDSRRYDIYTILDQLKDSKTAPERKDVANSGRTSCVYDIYEVRDISEDCKNCTNEEKQNKKLVWEGEKRLGKPDPVVEEIFESNVKDETEWVKPMLVGAKQEKRSSNTRECKLTLVQPTANVAEFQKLSQRIECLEAERNSTSQEIIRNGGDDQLNLLREIHQQLNSIKHEMTNLKAEKSSQHEDSCLVSLKDVCFFHSVFFMLMLTFTSNFGNTIGFLMAGPAALLALRGIVNDMLCGKKGIAYDYFQFCSYAFCDNIE